jgi:hypothetical protein
MQRDEQLAYENTELEESKGIVAGIAGQTHTSTFESRHFNPPWRDRGRR